MQSAIVSSGPPNIELIGLSSFPVILLTDMQAYKRIKSYRNWRVHKLSRIDLNDPFMYCVLTPSSILRIHKHY